MQEKTENKTDKKLYEVQHGYIKLWTVQPRAVWDALQSSRAGCIGVDPDHPGLWQSFRPSYEWLAEQMAERISSCTGGLPWWAWTTRPDMRYHTWTEKKDSPFCLIELAIPLSLVCLTDFDSWVCVLNGWYVPRSKADLDEWRAAWEARFGGTWDKEKTDPLLLSEYDRHLKRSWQRIYEWDSPLRDPEYMSDLVLQATFEFLDKKWIKKVSHHVGRKTRNVIGKG